MSYAFSIDSYAELLRSFIGRGYIVVDFDRVAADKAHLVLRHDLDMSLLAGVEIAECEAKMCICAHYFVLMRTEMYNPWSAAARDALRRILDGGHRVGLHFDAALYEDDDDALEAGCTEECAALEQLLGEAVTMVSFHRPATRLQGLSRRFAGRRHSYEPQFFRDIGYCSDSRGEWRHGHPFDHPAVAGCQAVQLLTHPVWWTRRPGETAMARLERLRRDRERQWAEELAANCDVYRIAESSP